MWIMGMNKLVFPLLGAPMRHHFLFVLLDSVVEKTQVVLAEMAHVTRTQAVFKYFLEILGIWRLGVIILHKCSWAFLSNILDGALDKFSFAGREESSI